MAEGGFGRTRRGQLKRRIRDDTCQDGVVVRIKERSGPSLKWMEREWLTKCRKRVRVDGRRMMATVDMPLRLRGRCSRASSGRE